MLGDLTGHRYSESLADAKGTSKKLAAAAAAAIGKDVSQFLVKVEDNAALTVGASDKSCKPPTRVQPANYRLFHACLVPGKLGK